MSGESIANGRAELQGQEEPQQGRGILSRLATRQGVGGALMRGVLALGVTMPVVSTVGCTGQQSAEVLQARQGIGGLQVAWFLAEKILGELDYAGLENNVQNLGSDLSTLESTLSRTEGNLAGQVQSLRERLKSKVDKEDIRQVVTAIITALDNRLNELRDKASKLQGTAAELEELLGFVPTVTPEPLIRPDKIGGEPKAHPLTLEWGKLLLASERSRMAIEERGKLYTKEDKEMQRLVSEDGQYAPLAKDLHQRILEEIVGQLGTRRELRRAHRLGHPAVRAFDRSMSSLAWLGKASQPSTDPQHVGRLPVPQELLGPKASDVITALKLSGAKPEEIVGLLKLVFIKMKPTTVSLIRASKVELPESWNRCLDKAHACLVSAKELKTVLRATRAELPKLNSVGPQHPLHEQLAQQQAQHVDAMRRLATKIPPILNEGLQHYAEALGMYRPDADELVALRRFCIEPLWKYDAALRCIDWGNPEAVQVTAESFANCHVVPTYTLVPTPTSQLKLPTAQEKKKRFDFCPRGSDVEITDTQTGRVRHLVYKFLTYERVVGANNAETRLIVWDNGKTSLYDLESLQQLYQSSQEFFGYFVHDQTVLVGCAREGVLFIDASTGKELVKYSTKELGTFLNISPDGTHAILKSKNLVIVMSTETGELLQSLDNGKEDGYPYFLDDGTLQTQNSRWERVDKK